MNSKIKLFTTLATAAIGVSMAAAQEGFGYGYGYASASYYESNYGIYGTVNGSQSGPYSYGYGAYATASGQYHSYSGSYSVGEAVALGVPGGSFGETSESGYGSVTWTNYGNYYDTLYVYAYTEGYGYGYASSWDAGGEGVGEGFVEDSDGAAYQVSYALAQKAGLGYSSFYEYESYDSNYGLENYGFGYVDQNFPGSVYADSYDYQLYAITLAPGESDTWYVGSSQTAAAIATTPGPVAVAPFALGLLGALRRRKKA